MDEKTIAKCNFHKNLEIRKDMEDRFDSARSNTPNARRNLMTSNGIIWPRSADQPAKGYGSDDKHLRAILTHPNPS